jgi:hypothetical protein
MLAGDVDAELDDGTLEIEGDGADNAIIVEQLDADSFSVSGLGTTLNGGPGMGPLIFDGVESIEIAMKGGGDLVFIGGDGSDTTPLSTFEGDIEVRMGLGDDFLGYGALFFGVLAPLDVDGDVDIETSDGDDFVGIGQGNHISGDLFVNTGLDDDILAVGNPGGPAVVVDGNATLKTSRGDDDVVLEDLEVGGQTRIETSDGEDNVTIRESLFSDLAVNTGLDDDTLVFDAAAPTTVTGDADLNGSGDFDTLNDDGLVVLGTRTTRGFEVII